VVTDKVAVKVQKHTASRQLKPLKGQENLGRPEERTWDCTLLTVKPTGYLLILRGRAVPSLFLTRPRLIPASLPYSSHHQ
jgi:hypothetical protein